MKKLTVNIRAELEIPDDWEVVEHSNGIQVLKVGDKYVDFDIAPLATMAEGEDAIWSDEDEVLTASVLEAVTGLDTSLEIS